MSKKTAIQEVAKIIGISDGSPTRDNMETKELLPVTIYKALNAKGAGLGNASIGIIESAIDEFEASRQSAQADLVAAESANIEPEEVIAKRVAKAKLHYNNSRVE